MKYFILALLPIFAYATEYGYWYNPTNTQYDVQSDSTAMTFALGYEGDSGRVYVVFAKAEGTYKGGKLQTYNHVGDQWYTKATLPTIPMRGPSICPWHNHGTGEYKIFYIPYDWKNLSGVVNDTMGHIFEYDIPKNTWKKIDTVPQNNTNRNLGKGMSLTTGDYWSEDNDFINIYWFGGLRPHSTGFQNKGFYVYRRRKGPYIERGPVKGDSWYTLAEQYHNDGADLTYHPDDNSVYAFKGFDTRKFLRYDITNDEWHENLELAPNKVKGGGSLTTNGVLGADQVGAGNSYIYAFRGDNKDDFWHYNLEYPSDPWNEPDNPVDPPTNVNMGADLAFGYYYTGSSLLDGV